MADFKDIINFRTITKTNTLELYSQVSEEKTANPVSVLAASAPEFMPNMYDVYILVRRSNNFWTSLSASRNLQEIIKMFSDGSDLRSYVNDINDFSEFKIKCKGVNFPQKTSNVDSKVLFGQVHTKIAPGINTKRKASLEVKLDSSLLLFDGLNILSNYYGSLTDAQKIEIAGENPKIDFSSNTPLNYFNFIYPSLYRMQNKYDITGPNPTREIRRPVIDIIVKYNTQYLAAGDSRPIDSTVPLETQLFIFEDIRFLGRTSSLEFIRGDGEPLTATYDFTYKDTHKSIMSR